MTFTELGLAAPLLQNVTEEGYTTPTPIQAQAIPHVIAGKDFLGCAQTGTGKTAAFALPMLHRMMETTPPRGARRHIRGLVLSPTRELAAQIGDSLRTYGRNSGVFHTVIFGGVNQYHQVRAIGRGIDILVATPGRLLDLIGQGFIRLDGIEFFVLDEADRMLDMGFMPDIERIIALLPQEKQTLLFSATMPGPIRQLADGLLKDPVSIEIEPVRETTELIDQSVCFVDAPDKGRLLVSLLRSEQCTRAVVFARTKMRAERVVRRLEEADIPVDTMHSDKSQAARQRALFAFKAGQVKVLVATDIAARGLDVDNISHVFNFDMPREPETYVHRIGRTGRAGARGTAISFVARDERRALSDVQYFLNQRLPVRPLPQYLMDEEPDRPYGMREDGYAEQRQFANNAPQMGNGSYNRGPQFGGPNFPAQPAFAQNAPRTAPVPAATAPKFKPINAPAANLASAVTAVANEAAAGVEIAHEPAVAEVDLAATSLARELLDSTVLEVGDDEVDESLLDENGWEVAEGYEVDAEELAKADAEILAAAEGEAVGENTVSEAGATAVAPFGNAAVGQQAADPFQSFNQTDFKNRDDRRRDRRDRNERGERVARNDRRPQHGEQRGYGNDRRPQYGEQRGGYSNDRREGGNRRERGAYGQPSGGREQFGGGGGQYRERGPRRGYQGNYNDGQQRYERGALPPDAIAPAAQAGIPTGGQRNDQSLLYVRPDDAPGYPQPGEQGRRNYDGPRRSYFAGPAGEAANAGGPQEGDNGGYQQGGYQGGVQYGQRQPNSRNDQGEGFWPKRRREYDNQGGQGGHRQDRQQGGYGQQSGGRRFGGGGRGPQGQGGGYGDRRQGGYGGGGGYGQQRNSGGYQQGDRGQGQGGQGGHRQNYGQGGGYEQQGNGGGYGRAPFRNKKFGGSAPRYS